MPYGTIKVDNITFTNGGTDETTTVSGIYKAITSGVTVSGTISGTTIQGQTISGVTVTGTTANFVSGVFTTQISGATVTGTTANFTSGNFTALSGASTTVTSGIFAVGSAAAPSISFASDPNTGIYSPGADQVAISTNGTGRLFVDASGNVGVATASPGTTLAVNGNIGSSGRGTSFGYTLPDWRIYNSSSGGALVIDNYTTEALRITSAGLVGIGTSLPSNILHVSGTSSTPALFERTGSNGVFIGLKDGSVNNVFLGNTNGVFSVQTPGSSFSDKLVITSAGNVGIGTTGPLGLLDLGAADSATALAIAGWRAASYNGSILQWGGITASQWSTAAFFTAGSERARIDSSGRLLVGTSSSSTGLEGQYAKLQVIGNSSGGGGGSYFTLARDEVATSITTDEMIARITFGNTGPAEFAYISCQADGNAGSGDYPGRLVFSTTADGAASPTERLRITSAGLVGIGTSSVAVPLHISSSANGTPATSGTTQTHGSFRIAGSGTTGCIDFGPNGSNPWIQATDRTDLSQNYNLLLNPNGGRVGIGTTSPQGLCDVAGSNGRLVLANGNTSGGMKITATNAAYSANGYLAFEGYSTEYGRFDSSGRLLVGTSTARSNVYNTTYAPQIQLEGTDNSNSALSIISCFNGTSIGGQLILGKANSGSVGVNGIVASGNPLGRLSFQGNDGSEFVEGAGIEAQVDGTPGANDMPGRLVFSTTADGDASPTERMRINAAGYIKASNNGTYASSTGSLHELKGNPDDNVLRVENYQATLTGAIAGVRIAYSAASPNTTNRSFLYCDDSTALRAEIRSNGGLANFSANNANLSDRNAKKDISLAADTWNCLKEWEIVNYRYKDQPDDADLNLGVIAQQVAESCPEVITIFQEAKEATEDAPAQEERLGVKEQQMYWMAIKALQEAQVRIEQLEAEMAEVKAQLS